jgi:hypothetical protein
MKTCQLHFDFAPPRLPPPLPLRDGRGRFVDTPRGMSRGLARLTAPMRARYANHPARVADCDGCHHFGLCAAHGPVDAKGFR